MAWPLFIAHLAGIAAAAVAGLRSIRHGLIAAAVAPAVTAVWAGLQIAADEPATASELSWVPGLDIGFRFLLDDTALMLTLLVSGIGALVFIYAAGYFTADAAGGPRFPAVLLAFATSMLGLVWADSVWTLFIFWELTSITSFLLIGHKSTDEMVLTAARRALMITVGGGLALLAGLIMLAQRAGTTIISDMGPVESGLAASTAAVLVMFGVATKSAQVPFHVWLPGAMMAPTPVSAYLHSATMVKAGVVLMAVLGPALGGIGSWKTFGLIVGIASLIWGAVGALRQRDAKLILAWGTVSQLGLMVTLLATGVGKSIFAAVAMLFAHALFKACLFMVVGEVDRRTGTRDIDELSGLARSMPLAFAAAVASGLSMAGVPPLLGFASKEAAVEAVLKLKGFEAFIVGVAIFGGSALTVAYTLRFLIGVFGSSKPPLPGGADSAEGPTPTPVSGPILGMAVPAAILAAAGLLGFVFIDVVNPIVIGAAGELHPDAGEFELYRWPGLTTGFFISMAIVGSGTVIGLAASRLRGPVPRTIGADQADGAIDDLLVICRAVAARVQHGSMPVYLATMGTAAIIASLPFVAGVEFSHLRLWDSPLQGVLAAAVVVSAFAGAFVGSRLGAALSLGAVGIGVSGLFVVQGAPDLALTQLLVETVIVVGFVMGLGHLASRFPGSAGTWRTIRLAMAGLGGLAVMAALIAAGADPTGQAPVEQLAGPAAEEGGGDNIVNVILTDVRALDTLGEVVVLATAAVGVLALARASRPAVAATGRPEGASR